MRRFRYVLDPLCLAACACYALNRGLLSPHWENAFLRGQFDDLLLLPAALPPTLWIARRLGLRRHDGFPTSAEILGHLAVWAVVCEIAAPALFSRSVGDMLDVAAYATGSVIALLWWASRPAPGKAGSHGLAGL